MTFYRALPTCTSGGWSSHQHALCARGEGPWSIFSASARKPWGMGATVGVMTKSSRSLPTPSAAESTTASVSAQPRKPSLSSELVRSQQQLPAACSKTAQDWGLKVDLGKQLKFPGKVAVTTLRPDMVLLSEASKQVILLELTVPWEERI